MVPTRTGRQKRVEQGITQWFPGSTPSTPLDELLRAVKEASTELVNPENVTEEELTRYCDEFKTFHLHYAKVLEKRGAKLT